MAGPGGAEVGRISIRVVPNTDRFRTELKAQLEEIENSVRGKVHVEAELDSRGLRAELDALTTGKEVKIKPDIQIGDALAKLSVLRAALAKDAKLEIEVDVDRNRLQRTLGSIGDKFSGAFSGGGGGLGGLGSFADTAALVAAVAVLIAPALALVSGVLVSLPALLSAVLIPIGAVALGLDGLKKAAEVVKPDLDALKQTMSQRFQDVFTPILEKTKPLFRALQDSLPGVATAIGTVADAFVNTVTSGPGLDRIKSIIGNISKAITDSAPGVTNFTNGLLTLADKVSAKLPGLSTMFNGWGESFSGWVKKITAVSWFDGKSPLDRGLTSFKETMQELLNIVGDLADKGFKFLSDPEFGKKMKEFVADVKDLVNNVLPSLGKFFTDMTDALNGINSTMDKIKGNSPAAAENSKTGPGGHDNGFDPLPEGNSNLINALASINIPLLIANQFREGNALSGVWESIKQQAATAFTEIAIQATPILNGIWANLTTSAAAAWNGLVGFIAGVVAQIIGQVVQIPSRLSAAWSGLGGAASQAWSTVVSAVKTAMVQAAAAVLVGAAQIVTEAASIPGKVASAIGSLGGILVAAGRSLMDGLLSGIKAGLSAVLDFASGIAAKIAAVKGPLPKDRTTLTPAGQALMQGLQDGIEGGLQGVLERAAAIGKAISDAIANGTSGASLGTLPSDLKRSLDEIDLEKKQLKVQSDATTDKGEKSALKDQTKQLQTLRDQLSLQSDQLGFSDKYGDNLDKQDTTMGDSLNKIIDIGKNFALANVHQFESDLGISGNGAIPQLAEMGLGWGTQMLGKLITSGFGGTNIHVNSIDEGLAARQNIQNKQALQFAGR